LAVKRTHKENGVCTVRSILSSSRRYFLCRYSSAL